MEEIELIAPPKTVNVSFSLEPVYNALNSLMLLSEASETSGFNDWVYQTSKALSEEERLTNQFVIGILHATGLHLTGTETGPSFSTWLETVRQQNPYETRDRELESIAHKAKHVLDQEVNSTQILADRTLYLSIIERTCEVKGLACDLDFWKRAHALLSDPPSLHTTIVNHLQMMWDRFIASEWDRHRPMLQEAAAAFNTLDLTGMPLNELFQRVAKRDLPPEWEEKLAGIDQLIFIPSAHIGPYLLLIGRHEGIARVVFGARIPEGVATRSPALSRSEMLMRLNALSDDTRLSILELLAQKGELSAQEIQKELDLSQSATSRHLRQLTASGFLSVQRCEGVRCYQLNRDRIEGIFGSLQQFLQKA
jgi:DNA-binding transcriptional ArsR family regulator